MARLYLDTNVVFAYCLWRYCNESNIADSIIKFFNRGLDGEFEIFVSQLTLSELALALSKKGITEEIVDRIIKEIRDSEDISFVKIVKPPKDFFKKLEKSSELHLSLPDAMQLILAQDIGCSYFVTNDTDLLNQVSLLKSKKLVRLEFEIVSVESMISILDKLSATDISLLSGKAFEDLIKSHFEDKGFDTVISAGPYDEGVDFIIQTDNKRVGVDAKSYLKSPVSSSEIIRMLDNKPENVHSLWIVSVSGFSKEAEALAKKRPNELRLINGKDIVKRAYNDEEKKVQNLLKPYIESQIEEEIGFNCMKARWKAVRDAKTNKAKKESLEGLATFLFSSIKDIKVQRNLRTSAEEIDLLLQNESKDLFWSQLGSPLIVECKNWHHKVGTNEIIIFKDKLDTAGIKVGVFVALNGITGTKHKDAYLKIREYKQREYRIIVLTGEDIEDISNGQNPTDKIKEKYYEIFKI
jgi:predicted nucleic acid-binding protein